MVVCLKQTQKTLNPFPVRFYDTYVEAVEYVRRKKEIRKKGRNE